MDSGQRHRFIQQLLKLTTDPEKRQLAGELFNNNTTVRLPSSTERQPANKFSKLWGSTPVWTAIGVLIGAVISNLSRALLFVGVWAVLWLEFIRVGFFALRTAKWLGNIVVGCVLAGIFLLLWRLLPEPKVASALDQDIAKEVLKALPDWVKSSNPPQSTVQLSVPKGLSDPVLHVEPENGVVWSTGPKQTQGVFPVVLSNTGLEDVSNVDVEEQYFVAERGPKETVLKNLGTIPSSTPILKGGSGKLPITLDFRPYLDTVREVMTSFAGASVLGVKISATFRRRQDGKNFSITSVYGALNPSAPAIYTSNSGLDQSSGVSSGAMAIVSDGHNYFTDSVDTIANVAVNRGRPRLSEIRPYMDMPDHWVPVIKEISDGNVTRQY